MRRTQPTPTGPENEGMIDLSEPPRTRSRTAGAALALAWFAILVIAYSIVLLRTGAVDTSAGFAAVVTGLALALLAAVVAVVAMVVVWRTGAKGGARALFALALAGATLGGPAYVAARGLAKPAINDISTDLADPPPFDRAAADRRPGDGPAPGAIPQAQAALQREAYPDIAPLRLALPSDEVANLVLGLIEEREWAVLGPTSYPRGGGPTGRVQAVARTALLGLKDDVSIRVRPDGDGAIVDMRSASRIGRGDLGANAERIRGFLADLTAAANAP